MCRLSAVLLDRFIRTLVCFALIFSTLGSSAALPVVAARPLAEQPRVSDRTSLVAQIDAAVTPTSQ
jgi:hypothetical protein